MRVFLFIYFLFFYEIASKKCPKGPLGDGDMPKLKIEFVNGKTAKIIFNNMEYTFDLNSTSCEELVNIFKDNFGEYKNKIKL